MQTVYNTLMVLTIPGAAQSVLRPLCLLPGLAAHQHVRWCDEAERSEAVSMSQERPIQRARDGIVRGPAR